MKQFLKIAAVFMFAAAFFVSPAQAGYDHYTINVYKDIGVRSGSFGYPTVTSGCQYEVLDAGTRTRATIYSDSGLTSMTNPVTYTVFDAEGKVDFYLADTASTCDILLIDNDGGYTLYMDAVTPSVHSAIINEQPGVLHHGMIWYDLCTATDWSGTGATNQGATAQKPYDTAIDFHVYQMITDFKLEVIQAAATSGDPIDIGLAAAKQDFADDMLTDGCGFVDLIFSDACTVGNLLFQATCSGTAGKIAGDGGTPMGYVIRTAASLNYAVVSADTTNSDDAGYGYIHYWFLPIRR